MNPRVAIVADDLTGALDTSTPFVAAGMSVAVAVTIEGVTEALVTRPQVIAVNTASRDMAPEAAALAVTSAAGMLACGGPPGIVFKKVDSRLKGNIGAETAALAEALGFTRAVVAPAVPDQARFARGGAVVGRGLGNPLPIAPFFDGLPLAADIRDAESDGDLDRIVAGVSDWNGTLIVGARGLGGALARLLGDGGAGEASCVLDPDATLFAFGSTDPITLAQIDALRPLARIVEARDGHLHGPHEAPLPLVLHTSAERANPSTTVAQRFADDVARTIATCRPSWLVMGGGETTLAILRRLGVGVLHPIGEAAPGLPAFDIALGGGKSLRCITKSGGFGSRDVLVGLLQAGRRGHGDQERTG
jgi:D-threonate/D-erythronate kinase